MIEFTPFGKIPRYRSSLCITEKIDGTNAQVYIVQRPVQTEDNYYDDILTFGNAVISPYCIDTWVTEDGHVYAMFAGSRKRWIAPEGTEGLEKGCDNYAFARFVMDNRIALRQLGQGSHYGEWYGKGIARNYDQAEKKFALFNAIRWNRNNPNRPACCDVVDIIKTEDPAEAMMELKNNGSRILTAAGTRFHKPEGIIIYHPGSKSYFKQTFEYDKGKWSEE